MITYFLKQSISTLNETLELKGAYHVASKKVATYCLEFLPATHLDGNAVKVLHILGLIEQCFPCLDADDVKVVCEGLLSLSTSSNPLI